MATAVAAQRPTGSTFHLDCNPIKRLVKCYAQAYSHQNVVNHSRRHIRPNSKSYNKALQETDRLCFLRRNRQAASGRLLPFATGRNRKIVVTEEGSSKSVATLHERRQLIYCVHCPDQNWQRAASLKGTNGPMQVIGLMQTNNKGKAFNALAASGSRCYRPHSSDGTTPPTRADRSTSNRCCRVARANT